MPPSKHDFRLPRATRLGALVLFTVLLVLIVCWRILPSLLPPQKDKEEAALEQAWTKFEKEHATRTNDRQQGYNNENASPDAEPNVAPRLFPFDPNTASEATLLALGLPRHTVTTILKYRAKSTTTFKRKEDLQKLYTLSKKDYDRIAPYVRIPESGTQAGEAYSPATSVKEPVTSGYMELNTATEQELIRLRGIGPAYAKRIIRFRDGLGGFLQVAQLQEVYGFPDSTYQQLKQRFTVNVTLVKYINVNIADEETLGSHTYIGRKLAANIIKLRNDLGQFKDLEQLRQVPLINEEKYRKIAPYLSTH